jgi:catechol 2,3-dioxygenase-like lactoylglutathione lyase family enzyme
VKISQFIAGAAFALTPCILAQPQDGVPRPAITGISHISVYSSDTAKADYFYVHDLGGLKRTDPENPQGVRYYFSATQFVEVRPLPAEQTSIDRLDHVAFVTANAENLRRYLAAHGCPVPGKVETGSDYSHWFEISDPEGNKVQFVQPPVTPSPVPVNPLYSHIIHVGYMVHSQSAEDAFYRTLLGFRPYWHGGRTDNATDWISQQVPDGTDWIEYMMVQGPETKGIPAGLSRASLGTMDHFSLGVDNMENTVELLYAGDRLTGKNNGPKIGRDGKWQFNMYDPDGTRAEIMEFQPVVKPCCSDFTASSPTR